MTVSRYGVGGSLPDDVVTIDEIISQAAEHYYVETTGSDSNDGSQASPFLTLQKAADQLIKTRAHGGTIHVGVGTFTGVNLTGFHFRPGGYVAIVGTMQAVALTGSMTGNVASATAGSNTSGTWSTLTRSGGVNWVADELRTKHVRIVSGTGAGQVRCIASNTTTVLTLPGAWGTTPDATSTFEIVEPGTTLSGAAAFPADYLGNGTSAAGRVKMSGNVGGGQAGAEFYSIFLDTLKTTGSQFLMNYHDSIAFVRCSIGNGINIFQGASILAADNAIPTASGGSPFYNLGGRLQANRNVITFVSNTGVAFSANMHVDFYLYPSTFLLQSNYVYQGRGAIQVGPLSFVKARGDKYFGNSVASATAVQLTSVTDTQTPTGAVVVDLDAVDISGWAVAAIRVAGPAHVKLVGVVSGTTNGTGINAAKGASVQVSSGTTLTGTVEVNIDGAGTTLALMRALAPKVIEDPNYHSKVYE